VRAITAQLKIVCSLVSRRYGSCFLYKQEVSNFTKQCVRVYFVCRRYVCECEDVGTSAGVFACVCVHGFVYLNVD